MSDKLLASLLKDKSNGCKRIINNHDVLNQLTNLQLITLRDRLEKEFNPKSDSGKRNKSLVASLLNDKLGTTDSVDKKPTESVIGTIRHDSTDLGRQIIEKTVVLSISIKQPSFKKSIDSSQFIDLMEADKSKDLDASAHTVSQALIDQSELKVFNNQRTVLYNALADYSVPSSVLGKGRFLIPIALVGHIDTAVSDFIKKRVELLDDLETRYDQLIENAKKTRGVFFNSADYPSFNQVRELFTVSANFESLNTPQAIAEQNKEIYEREEEKARIKWSQTADEITEALRAGFLKLTTHFVDRLKNGKNGKPKRLHASVIEDIKDFCNAFRDKNLTNDTELSILADRTYKLLIDNDIESIKKDENIKAKILKDFEEITQKADNLVEEADREFDF